MRDPESVKADCESAIVRYIENLPFNGEYTNMDLIDTLQAVNGVKIAELLSSASASSATSVYSDIDARIIPEAGYFTADNINIEMHAY